MKPAIRYQKIIDELNKKKILYIEELVEVLEGTSISTVRRDLKQLEKQGHIITLHGGAYRLKNQVVDLPMKERNELFTQEKMKIAEYAASLIENGDTIYLDSGTTVSYIMGFIKNKEVTIFTSNLEVVSELGDTKLKCILIGGEVVDDAKSVVGPIAEQLLEGLHFDKAFLGTNGLSEEQGISSFDTREANKKRLVKKNSSVVYVLADHTKFGKFAGAKAFDINGIVIVTDDNVNPLGFKEKCKVVCV